MDSNNNNVKRLAESINIVSAGESNCIACVDKSTVKQLNAMQSGDFTVSYIVIKYYLLGYCNT